MIPLRLSRQDGIVASVLGAGRFSVLLPGGQSIGARAGGSGLIITGAKQVPNMDH